MSEMKNTFDNRLDSNLKEVNRSTEKHFESASKLIRDVTKELSDVRNTGEKVLGFTEQLGQIEKILSNPKQRGELGEYLLDTVLSDILPPDIYETQYSFKNGDRVDAIIHLDKGKILPIDAKFSLENYKRLIETDNEMERKELEKRLRNDLKGRIEETSKYIKESENTMAFAFMFIPSETLYYDLLSNRIGTGEERINMIIWAHTQKRVIIISPTTLVAYLQTVKEGLKAFKIQEDQFEIIKKLKKLHIHTRKSYESFKKMGKSLNTLVNYYNDTGKKLTSVDKDIISVTESKEKVIDIKSIESPKEEE